MQDAMDYLTWTFFYRRLLQNPSYYDLEKTDAESINQYLSRMVLLAAPCPSVLGVETLRRV